MQNTEIQVERTARVERLQVACEMVLYKLEKLVHLQFASSKRAVLVNMHFTFVVLLVLILLAVLLALERLKGSPPKKYSAKQFHTHLA